MNIWITTKSGDHRLSDVRTVKVEDCLHGSFAGERNESQSQKAEAVSKKTGQLGVHPKMDAQVEPAKTTSSSQLVFLVVE